MMEESLKTFGQRFRESCSSRGISLAGAARILDMNASHLCRVLKGGGNPTYATLQKMEVFMELRLGRGDKGQASAETTKRRRNTQGPRHPKSSEPLVLLYAASRA